MRVNHNFEMTFIVSSPMNSERPKSIVDQFLAAFLDLVFDGFDFRWHLVGLVIVKPKLL
jgi:hypothetical protein